MEERISPCDRRVQAAGDKPETAAGEGDPGPGGAAGRHTGATATDAWAKAGRPFLLLPPEIVMSAEDAVDAALAGLDQGELVTIPGLKRLQSEAKEMITINVIVRQVSFDTYRAEVDISDDHGQPMIIPAPTKGRAIALAQHLAHEIEASGIPVQRIWQS
jgi:hypothetical protein